MKKLGTINIIGVATVVAAFATMATGAVLSIHILFLIGAAVLFAGIIISVIVPAIVIAKWNRLLQDHGVPAQATLLSATPVRAADVRLELAITDSETLTSAIIVGGKKNTYIVDTVYNIKYDPKNPEYCLLGEKSGGVK